MKTKIQQQQQNPEVPKICRIELSFIFARSLAKLSILLVCIFS